VLANVKSLGAESLLRNRFARPFPRPPWNLDETIRQNAEGPAEASGDSGSVKQHALRDQIEADRYLNSKRTARAEGPGVRLTKLVPPGAS